MGFIRNHPIHTLERHVSVSANLLSLISGISHIPFSPKVCYSDRKYSYNYEKMESVQWWTCMHSFSSTTLKPSWTLQAFHTTEGVTHVHGRMKKLQRDGEKDSSSDRNNQELHVFTLSEYTLRCTNPRGVETPRSLEISPNNIHNIASPPLPLRSQRRSR